MPACEACGGLLKPDVVFFGERVPAERVQRAFAALEQADAMLVVGSSLMVYSGYRFAQAAADAGKPIAAVNLGRTRADELLTLKVTERCADALAFLLVQRCPAGRTGRNCMSRSTCSGDTSKNQPSGQGRLSDTARFKPVRNDEVARAQAIRLNGAHLGSRCCHDVAAHLK